MNIHHHGVGVSAFWNSGMKSYVNQEGQVGMSLIGKPTALKRMILKLQSPKQRIFMACSETTIANRNHLLVATKNLSCVLLQRLDRNHS